MINLDEKTYRELLEDRQERAKLADENFVLKTQILWYREQLGLAKNRLFAPSSEQTPSGQESILLFNELEALADLSAPEPECKVPAPPAAKKPKQSGQREMQVASLPVEEHLYTLPEEEQVCPQCEGALHSMGCDERREVQVTPAVFTLVIYKQEKFACRNCNRNEIHTPIKIASAPETAFPGSLASPSLVAYIMGRKFVEGTPLYRQEASLKGSGFEISRQTMANWMLSGANWLEKIYGRMYSRLLARDILHADETTLQVLNEEGRAAQTKSYMWLYRTGRDGPPIVLYEYKTTRASAHPRAFLKGFKGYLHVDGYAGYEGILGVSLAGCWAHVRRKFLEALQLLPPADRNKQGAIAAVGLDYCNRLFAIERDLHDVTPQERKACRGARSKPLLDAFQVWLEVHTSKVLPKSALGSAIKYARNQWNKLITFLNDGRLEIDNNRAERSIKPFVIGRKNWMFSNTPKGAKASEVIYSIVETAKENGLDPFRYLAFLFQRLPNIDHKNDTALDTLMPWSESAQAACAIKTSTSTQTISSA